MNPQYLNSLKAGLKTALVTFITTILAALPGLMDALRSWTVDGNPPNMDSYQKLGLAAVLALMVGIGNVVMRFLQAASVPFLGSLFDKILGVIPDYLPPDEGPVDAVGDANPGLNRDAGEINLTTLFLVLALVCFVVFALIAHGTFKTDAGFTWLGAGLASWVLAILLPSFDRRNP